MSQTMLRYYPLTIAYLPSAHIRRANTLRMQIRTRLSRRNLKRILHVHLLRLK